MNGIRIRFETKPGKSRASAGVLPSSAASAMIAAAVSSEVSSPRITSTSASTGTGLKKCMPITRSGRPVAAASDGDRDRRRVRGEDRLRPAKSSSARRKTSSFTAASSTTASIIRSAATSSSTGSTRASTSVGLGAALLRELRQALPHRREAALGRAGVRVVEGHRGAPRRRRPARCRRPSGPRRRRGRARTASREANVSSGSVARTAPTRGRRGDCARPRPRLAGRPTRMSSPPARAAWDAPRREPRCGTSSSTRRRLERHRRSSPSGRRGRWGSRRSAAARGRAVRASSTRSTSIRALGLRSWPGADLRKPSGRLTECGSRRRSLWVLDRQSRGAPVSTRRAGGAPTAQRLRASVLGVAIERAALPQDAVRELRALDDLGDRAPPSCPRGPTGARSAAGCIGARRRSYCSPR